MPNIIINNQTLHYLDQGKGPVLLFGHSYLWSSSMWKQQITEFSKEYRCIAPDLWGHGSSGALNEIPSIQSLADDHWALLQALKIERCSLIGLSVGGMWGVQLALDHPREIEKLVIMDSFVGVEASGAQQRYLQMLDIVEQANSIPLPLIQQLIPMFLSGITLDSQPSIAEAFRQSLISLPTENIQTIISIGRCIFKRKDRMEVLSELKMPVLVLVGELDQPRPPHESKQMAHVIENAEFNIIAKAGHISALEQPNAVNKLLRAFLALSYNIK
ncbi:MAG: alpha/beta fold hydrolase [Candidatus Endonucleobacter bathymodioli]|uniref:Alpha/beta fold hydrolase n=1 Tax=Candidatus Endonucleibacter bathymodioli TaxID=539814 RepID=A0AA90NLL9_9GAMM|nr:alpha/beta fold hydrolase [Candidatus Endonucleobacter bathymodioli]